MESISFKSDQSQGNRLSIHLDAVGGISGDMFASAFLDLNPELMAAIKAVSYTHLTLTTTPYV